MHLCQRVIRLGVIVIVITVAAAGHYGNKSPRLVRDYATDLGYEYLTASNKEEFIKVIDRFLTPEITDKPMLLEVFTDTKDESDALEMTCNVITDPKYKIMSSIKNTVKGLFGDEGVEKLKKTVIKLNQ